MTRAERDPENDLLRYWQAVADDPNAPPPEGLDPLAGAIVRGLRELRPPDPESGFVARLGAELQRRAAGGAPVTPRPAVLTPFKAPDQRSTIRGPAVARRRPLLVGLTAAAALVIAVFSVQAFTGSGTPVSATAILQKAGAAADPVRFRGFAITETSELHPATLAGNDDAVRNEITRWYEAPGRWRREVVSTVVGPDGEVKSRGGLVSVSDGATLWIHRLRDNTVIIRPSAVADRDELGPFPEVTGGLSGLLAQAGACYTPSLTGSETIAGRPTYVIALGRSRCAPGPEAGTAAMGAEPVEWTVWVDKDTFLILKSIQEIDGAVVATTTVTGIQYNIAQDDARFRFTPPAGAKIRDARP